MRRPTPRQFRKALDATETPEFKPPTHAEPSVRDLMDRGLFTRVGWVAPSRLSHEGWLSVGTTILAIEQATPWWWGDWYATRGLFASALISVSTDDWSGPAYHTLQNYASVAMAFPHSRRREALSFKHHAELTYFAATEQDKLLDWCIDTCASVAALRAEKQRRKEAELPPSEPPSRSSHAKIELLKPRSPPRPIMLYLSEELESWVTTAANDEGLSLEDWVRRLIQRAKDAD